MHPMLEKWFAFRDWLSEDLLGGPRPWKFAWVINSQKGGTLPFVLLLMWWFDNWTTTAWVYAGLHGSYGLIWLLKDVVFPDPNWQKRITIAGGIAAWLLVLGPYWLAPILIVTQRAEAPPWLIGLCILVYALGVVVMIGSDAQKYFVLKERRGLITNGFFGRVRHPNYLGEMMLYGSFAALSMHWAPWLILAWVWLGVFTPNMLRKEASMSRYPAWAAYKARSGFLLPKLFVPEAPATPDDRIAAAP
jgi:protein-S-isoprenylcysteine O-methyltransferase Ste14